MSLSVVTGGYAVLAFEGVGESALRLTGSPAKPGVLAPAQAYDPADFLNSLAVHGVRYTIG